MKKNYISPMVAGCVCAFLLLSFLWILAGWTPEAGYLKQWHETVRGIWSDPAHGLPRIWSGSLTVWSVLLCVGYLFGACVLGSVLFVRPLLLGGGGGLSVAVLLAGFVPGYLLLAPLNRFLSLLMANRRAAFLELGLLAAFCGWRFLRWARSARGSVPAAGHRGPFWARATAVGWPFLALAIILVWGLCHVTGDATGFTFVGIFGDPQRFPAPLAKLPFFGQHYDEICFLHPVLFSGLFSEDSDLLTPYWLMTGFARMSVLLLAYMCTRRLGLRRFESAAVAAFLFLSSMSINPGADWEFVDSSHPMVLTVHPARLVGALAPLVFAMAYSRTRRTGGRWPRLPALCVCVLFGAGLVAISIHVFAMLLLMAGLCFLLVPLPGSEEGLSRPLSVLLAPCLLAFLPLAYTRSFLAGHHHLFFGLLFLALGSYSAFRNRCWPRLKVCLAGPGWRTRLAFAASLLAGAAFGMVFLGNLLAPTIGLYKVFGADLLTRGVPPGTFSPGLINTRLPVPPGANVLWSASSPSHFIAALGLPVLLAAFVFLLHGLLKPEARRQAQLLSLLECLLLGLLCAVGLFHFMGGNVDFWLSLWVRSRFTEGWFYGLSAVALCALFPLLSARSRHFLCSCVLFWALLPWSGLSGGVLGKQCVANFRWMVSSAGK